MSPEQTVNLGRHVKLSPKHVQLRGDGRKNCLKIHRFRARSSAVEHLTFNQVVVGSIPTGLTRNP
jgi:hypothetical protein